MHVWLTLSKAMYNGYNYYPPNGSSATSPVYLMPYPYQYDPFFMTPNGMQPPDGEDTTEGKTEEDGVKEKNQHDENQDVSFCLLIMRIAIFLFLFWSPVRVIVAFNVRRAHVRPRLLTPSNRLCICRSRRRSLLSASNHLGDSRCYIAEEKLLLIALNHLNNLLTWNA